MKLTIKTIIFIIFTININACKHTIDKQDLNNETLMLAKMMNEDFIQTLKLYNQKN